MQGVVIDVLRTRELQRLRRIRQLGMAYFVFPGAEHSRLVHCLGASHLAIRFGLQLIESSRDFLTDLLLPNEVSIRDLAVAALCHDLGHGPLSHAWEKEIVGENFDRSAWFKKLQIPEDETELLKNAKWHEIVGHGLLAWKGGELHELLEHHEIGSSRRLRFLLRGKHYLPYLPGLLRGDIDVDRADFLRRDTHQTGVAYGRFDLDWLISTCTVGQTVTNKLVVGFDQRKGLRVVEQFLIARRALYDTVYHHKTVHSAEGMIALFLKRLREFVLGGGEVRVDAFVKPMIDMISGLAVEPKDVLSLDDFAIWSLINEVTDASADSVLSDLGSRILTRNLFKMIPCTPDRVREFMQNGDWHERLLAAIRPFCPGEPKYYLAVDYTSVSFFSSNHDEDSFLIDENRLAIPMCEHEDLRGYAGKANKMSRLFTLREAVSAVKNIIDPPPRGSVAR